MDKNNFLLLINRYTEISPDEARGLAALKAEYPYCQLLQTLYARLSRDNAFESHEQDLAMAAVLAADRAVLKEIIYAERRVADPPALVPSPALTAVPLPADDQIDYADEVMRDLAKLSILKTNFEMLSVEYSEVYAASQPKDEEEAPDRISNGPPPAKARGKSRKQRIVELARGLQSPASGDVTGKPMPKKAREKKTEHPDELIEEIKTSKKAIRSENEKQKEQTDIINNFIRTQPSITGAKDRTILPPGDLNPVKSGEFGDNIVSETLVEILVRQGKKDKAIEVLKKLIWKYPQKKSYFASQIEDLKK